MDSTNIASHLSKIAKQQPDTPAIIIAGGHNRTERMSGFVQFTYKQLDEDSDRIARGLQQIGIEKGTRTVLMVKPGLDFFSLVFALFKLKAVLVAIDPGIGIKNLGNCLAQAKPHAFIGIPTAHLARWLFRWANKHIKINVMAGSIPGLITGMMDLERIRHLGESHHEQCISNTTADDEIAAILFTSGSTGSPKGAVYTYANFNAQIKALQKTYAIQMGEIDLGTFPLFTLFSPALGMTSIIPEMDFTRPGHVDPRKIIDAINNFKVTSMFGSPALLNRVGQWSVDKKIKLPSLKRVLSAGAPVSPAIVECFQKTLAPGIQIYTPYGATEALPISSIGSNEILNETRIKTNQGMGICIGRPVNGIDIKIIQITELPISSWDDVCLQSPGKIGEIIVQGAQVTAKYFNQEHATIAAKIYDSEGKFYHRMGDVGYFDEKQRLWFCGRKSDRVVMKDRTLFTIPCEGIYNVHPQVYRSALVGVKVNGTNKPVLCVELKQGSQDIDKGKVRQELLDIGNSYDQVREIKDILFHSSFPVDIRHNAKIKREKLARWARKQL